MFQTLSSQWLLIWIFVLRTLVTRDDSSHSVVVSAFFVSVTPSSPFTTTTRLHLATNKDNNNNEDNNWNTIESARRRLEDLLGSEEEERNDFQSENEALLSITNNDYTTQNRRRPHLTAIARLRKTAEIQLLAQLEFSSAEQALQQLWCQERGQQAELRLQQGDAYFQQALFTKAQEEFELLIKEYGSYWVEPLHRLSMVYYLQQRYQDAMELELAVLKYKPWHFGAISHLVRIAEAQQDFALAQQYASKRLVRPIQKYPKRRQQWVQVAVHQAMTQYYLEEERVRILFGRPYILYHGAEQLSWQ